MANQLEIIAQAREKVNAEIVPALLDAFAGKMESTPPSRDEIPQLFCQPQAIGDVARWLDEHGFNMLVDLTAADYYPKREPRFDVVYFFRQLPGLGQIRIRVRCTEKDSLPTLSERWPMANAAEREVYDQFGLKFKGHPNLKRVLNPEDWEGHPLRRDYPLRGPRALINLEMPADENRYRPFVDEEKTSEEGK